MNFANFVRFLSSLGFRALFQRFQVSVRSLSLRYVLLEEGSGTEEPGGYLNPTEVEGSYRLSRRYPYAIRSLKLPLLDGERTYGFRVFHEGIIFLDFPITVDHSRSVGPLKENL